VVRIRENEALIAFNFSREFFLTDKGWIDIEVVPGADFGFEKASSDQTETPDQLRLHLPNNSKVYTVRYLILMLSANYEKLANLIRNGKTGRLKGNALIIVNGTHIDLLNGLDTPIHVGDRIELIPIIAGG
jgi:molybdopterin converting factor small subunit